MNIPDRNPKAVLGANHGTAWPSFGAASWCYTHPMVPLACQGPAAAQGVGGILWRPDSWSVVGVLWMAGMLPSRPAW